MGGAAGGGNFDGEVVEGGVEGGVGGGEEVEDGESEGAGTGAGLDDGELGGLAADLPHLIELTGDKAAKDGGEVGGGVVVAAG